MEATGWAIIAASAATVSAFASSVGSFFTTRTSNAQVKTADFNNLLEVVKQLAEAQRRVRDAKDENIRTFELRELFNLMEALAKLVNARKIAPVTLEYTAHFLEEAWAFARRDPDMSKLIQESITGEETFGELRQFAQRRKGRIEGLSSHYHGPNIQN